MSRERTPDFEQRLRRAQVRAAHCAHKAWKVDDGLYTVHSATQADAWYTVRLLSWGVLRCECEAGRRSLPCWHAARVWMRLVRERPSWRLYELPQTPWQLFDDEGMDRLDWTPDVAA